MNLILSKLLRLTSQPIDQSVNSMLILLMIWRLLALDSTMQLLEDLAEHSSDFGVESRWHVLLIACWCILLVVSFFSGHRKWLGLASLILVGTRLCFQFPYLANHAFLNAFSVFAVSTALLSIPQQTDDNEAKPRQISRDAICVLRWLMIYAILWSGFNKLFYGTYGSGTFFAAMIERDDRFASFFRFLIPADEVNRLSRAHDGPFQFQSWLPIWGSHAVYLTEILAGVLLIWPRTTRIGAIFTLLIVIGIELAAKELVFGFLMVHLILLYFPEQFFRWGYWVPLIGYLFVSSGFILKLLGFIQELFYS